MSDTLAVVVRVLAEETEVPVPITAELALEEDLGLTSLGLTRVLVRLEDELDSELDDAVVLSAELRTVRDLVTLVERGRSVVA
jgi:acyl carrier protein